MPLVPCVCLQVFLLSVSTKSSQAASRPTKYSPLKPYKVCFSKGNSKDGPKALAQSYLDVYRNCMRL